MIDHGNFGGPMNTRNVILWRAGALILIVMLAVLVASLASAQTVPGTARISWTLPTHGCVVGVTPPACAPLTGENALTAINVYIDTQPIPADYAGAPTLTLPGNATQTTHTMQVPNGSTLYVRVRAINPAGASALSEQATKLIQVDLAPGVPTDVTIELEIG